MACVVSSRGECSSHPMACVVSSRGECSVTPWLVLCHPSRGECSSHPMACVVSSRGECSVHPMACIVSSRGECSSHPMACVVSSRGECSVHPMACIVSSRGECSSHPMACVVSSRGECSVTPWLVLCHPAARPRDPYIRPFMPLAITYSRAYAGMQSPLVTVESHISNGLPGLHIVGLAQTAVKESKERVRSALLNSQFAFPARRITINLAPAELPKAGSHYDLAIAVGILVASGQLQTTTLEQYEFAGELALSGALRNVHGTLPFTIAATRADRALMLAKGSETEANIIKQATVYTANHLLDVIAHFNQTKPLTPLTYQKPTYQPPRDVSLFENISGNQHAKRAIEIAVSGQHHMLMCGPPGAGKTLLANSIKSLVPALCTKKAEEVAAITSLTLTGFSPARWKHPPFRAPHHTLSNVALVGGSRPPSPGEISLAHHGLLFLDELTEFQRHVLECLRQPLEARKITISRAGHQVEFPAHFQLIAAMNPCPCGQSKQNHNECLCTPAQITQYQAKISAPLRDRFDIQLFIPKLSIETLLAKTTTREKSCEVKARIQEAQQRQYHRQNMLNVDLSSAKLTEYCNITEKGQSLLTQGCQSFQFSGRSTQKLIRVARTIADLAEAEHINHEHIAEAFSYKKNVFQPNY